VNVFAVGVGVDVDVGVPVGVGVDVVQEVIMTPTRIKLTIKTTILFIYNPPVFNLPC
jgi:hypothetical protein